YSERSSHRQNRGGLQRRPAGGAEGTPARQRAAGSGTCATLCSGLAGGARPARQPGAALAGQAEGPYSFFSSAGSGRGDAVMPYRASLASPSDWYGPDVNEVLYSLPPLS